MLLLFVFHFFHISKMFPFEDFFHLGKQTKKSCTDRDWAKRRVGHGEGRAVWVKDC